jgi:transposase
MSKVDRNNPKRSTASESRFSLMEFEREFPDDAACLEWLIKYRWPDGIFCPKCERVTKHHREKARPSYSCQFCGHRVHPMVGTIFEDSATSLRLWFYGFYLMSSTRCGISAKQLERELGVTYKTAWRMFHKIRSLLTQDADEPFSGTVEADETYIGGRAKWGNGQKVGQPQARGTRTKDVVFGVAQRGQDGAKGKVKATVVPHNDAASLIPQVRGKVLPASTVYTDELRSYHALEGLGYEHKRVSHSTRVYVSGDVHTNTIEGFWSLLKKGISGVYHGVSTEHLQSYLDEYAFRYNNRDATGRGMFEAFLTQIPQVSSES